MFFLHFCEVIDSSLIILIVLFFLLQFGKNLMQKLEDEVVTMEMVLSLSKLASKSISLAHHAQVFASFWLLIFKFEVQIVCCTFTFTYSRLTLE